MSSPLSPGWRVAAIAIVAAIVLAPFQRRLDDSTSEVSPVEGSESATVDRRLEREFGSPLLNPSVLVIGGLPRPANTDSGRAVVRSLLAPLGASRFVSAIVSPATSLDTLLVGADGTTAIALVGFRPHVRSPLDSVRALTDAQLAALRRALPSLTMRWTGQSALVRDLHTFGATQARRAELRALPVTAIVSIIAFPSMADALIAVAAGGLAIAITLGLAGLLAPVVPPSSFTRTIVPMVAMALTVDYALYVAWRKRGGAEAGALKRTIVLAAGVVAVGFTGLAVAPTSDLRMAAVAGVVACVVVAAISVAVTVLRPARGRAYRADSGRWLRWGELVVRRPWVVLVVSLLPVGWLANQARRANLVTPLEQLLPPGMESAQAFRDLERAGRGAAAGAIRVLVSLPVGTDVYSAQGWSALTAATANLRAVPAASDARSLATIGTHDRIVARYVIPDEVKRAFVSADGHAAVITVLPDISRGESESIDLARRIRALDAERLTGLHGSRLGAAGLPAYALDYETALRAALPWIVAATSVATFLVLAIALRAPVVAVKAVSLNLIVAAAAIGATVLVFQDGFGAALIGQHATGSVFPTVPVVAFGAAFGTSMDYELFLIGAVLEARRSGASDDEAIALGVGRTGGVITRAAAVMACLFLAFSTSALLPLAMVGFALAVAVVLDATLVRMALAPALLTLAGKWNWWPSDLADRPRRR